MKTKKVNRLSTDINQDILEIIQEHFPQFEESELINEIAANGKLIPVKTGDTLMDYGDFINLVPLVVKGVLKVNREDENGNEIFLYFIQGGQSCTMSFSCCIRKKRSEIRATVEDDALIIGVPVELVDAWLSKFQSWKNFIHFSKYNAINRIN